MTPEWFREVLLRVTDVGGKDLSGLLFGIGLVISDHVFNLFDLFWGLARD